MGYPWQREKRGYNPTDQKEDTDRQFKICSPHHDDRHATILNSLANNAGIRF